MNTHVTIRIVSKEYNRVLRDTTVGKQYTALLLPAGSSFRAEEGRLLDINEQGVAFIDDIGEQVVAKISLGGIEFVGEA